MKRRDYSLKEHHGLVSAIQNQVEKGKYRKSALFTRSHKSGDMEHLLHIKVNAPPLEKINKKTKNANTDITALQRKQNIMHDAMKKSMCSPKRHTSFNDVLELLAHR